MTPLQPSLSKPTDMNEPFKSPHTKSLRPVFIAISDIVSALLLAVWGLVVGPLGLLRGTLHISHVFWYVWVLSPKGLLSHFVKASIDWRLGNFDAAIFQCEFILSRVEMYQIKHPKYQHANMVLQDFYTLLVRAYLHGGHIDDAMSTVLRAKRTLQLDRLPGLARLDAKTAHLVRAGLAAGKLLEGGGLATLFVKSDAVDRPAKQPPAQNKNTSTSLHSGPEMKRQGASAHSVSSSSGWKKINTKIDSEKIPSVGGKLIPFRRKTDVQGDKHPEK